MGPITATSPIRTSPKVSPVSRMPAATLPPKAWKPNEIVAMPAPKNTSRPVPINSAVYLRAMFASITTDPLVLGAGDPVWGRVRPSSVRGCPAPGCDCPAVDLSAIVPPPMSVFRAFVCQVFPTQRSRNAINSNDRYQVACSAAPTVPTPGPYRAGPYRAGPYRAGPYCAGLYCAGLYSADQPWAG